MTLGPAYGSGDGALPYIEIIQTGTDDVTFDNTFVTWQWTSTAFDTSDGSLWSMSFSTDELTINKAGTYRIELMAMWSTTSSGTRVLGIVEKDPLGVGAFAYMEGSAIFIPTHGSNGTGFCSFTATLAATDKLRISTRRLSGTATTGTDGGNGPVWRVTKVG